MKIKDKRKWMKIAIVSLVFAALIAALIVVSVKYINIKNEIGEKEPTFEATFNVNYSESLLFNKYPIDILLDDEKIGNIENGDFIEISQKVKSGKHTLTFCKENNYEIYGKQVIEIYGDVSFAFNIKSESNKITINSLYSDSINK